MSQTQDARAVFLIVLHDVAPLWWEPLACIVGQLQPLVGKRLAAAVVPGWHAAAHPKAESSSFSLKFVEWVASEFDEILLHGYDHHQKESGDLLGLLTGRANEFTGVTISESVDRLQLGQALMVKYFGKPAAGFIPPAWQWGPITPNLLAKCGLQYGVGLNGIEPVRGGRAPLATWSWDWGILAPLGYLGEGLGHLMATVRPQAIPCLVFHPLDVERGFVKHGLHQVKRLLREGRQPVTFRQLLLGSGTATSTL